MPQCVTGSSHLINKELRPTECNQVKEDYRMDIGKRSHKRKFWPLTSCSNGELWQLSMFHLALPCMFYVYV